MTVRRHVPWPLRAASLALAVALGAVGGMWTWRTLFDGAAGERQRLHAELARLDERVADESSERQRVAATIVAAQNQLRIEQAAAERLEQQVKQLQAENAELKSDLAYLESLFPTADTQGPVAIRRFEVEPDGTGSNRMRYRALLMQSGRTERQFSGSLQLVVTMQGKAGTKIMTLPDDGPAQARERMKLSFRRVLRIEGHFQVPEGATLQSVQLRVLERGTLRAQQMASL